MPLFHLAQLPLLTYFLILSSSFILLWSHWPPAAPQMCQANFHGAFILRVPSVFNVLPLNIHMLYSFPLGLSSYVTNSSLPLDTPTPMLHSLLDFSLKFFSLSFPTSPDPQKKRAESGAYR